MTLTEAGESRVRGYLFVFERSLRSFLPSAVASDAVKEVGSHIRERLDQLDAAPDERVAVERVLAELGSPLRVAQAYSQEMVIEEAVVTGRVVPTVRAIWYVTTTSVVGFFWGLLVFCGWTIGVATLALPVLKLIFPDNVGLITVNGEFRGIGAHFPMAPGSVAAGGYWVMPIALTLGLLVIVVTQWSSRRILGWMRDRNRRGRVERVA